MLKKLKRCNLKEEKHKHGHSQNTLAHCCLFQKFLTGAESRFTKQNSLLFRWRPKKILKQLLDFRKCWEASPFESTLSLKWLSIKTSSSFFLTLFFLMHPWIFVPDFYVQYCAKMRRMILLLQQFLSSMLILQRIAFVICNLICFIPFEKAALIICF